MLEEGAFVLFSSLERYHTVLIIRDEAATPAIIFPIVNLTVEAAAFPATDPQHPGSSLPGGSSEPATRGDMAQSSR